MKYLLALLVLGQVSTYLILNSNQSQEPQTEVKTISYDSLNPAALKRAETLVQNAISEKWNQRETFANAMSTIFAYLKSHQVLYRYELNNSLKATLDKMERLDQDAIVSFNQEIGRKIDYHKKMISRLSFSQDIKSGAIRLLEDLRLQPTANEMKNPSKAELVNIQRELSQISLTKEMQFHETKPVVMNTPWQAVMGLWTALFAVALVIVGLEKKSKSSENEELVNPTLKKIMSELDNPLIMVDQNLNIVWQNKKSDKAQFNEANIQEMLKTESNQNIDFKFNDCSYSVELSELAYKSGKRNTLIQLKPQLTSNKHLEHLVNSTEIATLLESGTHSEFGDFNQTVAELSVKMGYLFKVSSKFLDLNLKPDLSDCFIETNRLEGMLKEFMTGCHHMVKDDLDVDGIFMRTDESANKFTISCFLNNFKTDSLENHQVTRDILRRFSILESKYAILNPMIDFQFKKVGSIKGLDVTLSFENRSRLETILSNVSANAI